MIARERLEADTHIPLGECFSSQAYMGHADVQTTMIYVHHVPKASAADELSREVAAATGVSPDVSREARHGAIPAKLSATEST